MVSLCVVPSFITIPNARADQEGDRIRHQERRRAASDWAKERQMPFLLPPTSPDDGAPDDFPDVDKRSCRLLGPTALVRTNYC